MLCIQVIMATGGRHGKFLDKWLKEFHWLQTRGTGGDLLMLCKDCLKAGNKNTFMTGCQNFQRSALVRHIQQVDHKSTAKVLQQQQRFKAASDNARAKEIFKEQRRCRK